MNYIERFEIGAQLRGWVQRFSCPMCNEPLQMKGHPRLAAGYDRLLARVTSPCGMFEADMRVSISDVRLAEQQRRIAA